MDQGYSQELGQIGSSAKKQALSGLFFLIPIFIVGLIWFLVSAAGIFPAIVFPSPVTVAKTFYSLVASKTLINYFLISLARLLYGFVIAFSIGVLLGYVMATVDIADRFFLPIVRIVNPIPGLAWIPLAILWFGLGSNAIAYIIFLAIFFPVLFNTREGFRLIERKYLEAAQVLGANKKRIFWEVRVPASIPFILVGARVGLAFGWRALVAGEMIAGSSGLGYMIFDARSYLRADIVIVGMLAIGVSWFIIDKIFLQTLEDKTIGRWKE